MPYLAAAVFVAVLILGLLGFFAYTSYNEVVALKQRIDKAWANIDVALKQRFDELPNLVNAVRGVMGFEQDVLTEVTRLRNAYSADAPVPDQAATSAATSSAIRQLFATVENYPQVKSAANVLAAVALMVAVPTIIVYIALQRHFIRGLTLGSTKG